MVEYIKETFKTFVSKQILLFFIANVVVVACTYLLEGSFLHFLAFSFITHILHIILYQYLIKGKIYIKALFALFFRFFFLGVGVAIISGTPAFLLEYLNFGVVVNTLAVVIQSYLFVRLCVLFPFLVANENMNIVNLWKFTKEKIYFWWVLSVFPIIFMQELIPFEFDKYISIVIYNFVVVIVPVFYSTYYKMKIQKEVK